MSKTLSFGLIIAALFFSIAFISFQARTANASEVANVTCAKCVAAAQAAKKDPYTTCKPVKCVDPTNGITTGHCELVQCHADSFSGGGQPGGSAGLDQVMKALGELFGKLMQQPPAPPTPPSTPPTFPGDSKGCTGTRFSTHEISQISNPCADYTPEPIVISPTTTDPDACPPLSQALGLCSDTPDNCPDVPAVECGAGKHPVSGGKDEKGCVKRDTCESDTIQRTTSTPPVTTPAKRLIFSTTTGTFVVPPGGLRGDINARPAGATVVGGSRDTQGNVEVVGFYGAQTFGGQGQGLVGAWCKSRPWASNFLSKIITPTFFDNICKSRGYQVGMPPAPAVTLEQTKKPKTTTATTTAATTTPTVPPKVDIWAVPASVPLGGRTSIFWNTQGVTNCTETSPNGGFNQNSLSGGAATQPITAATTFSISCLAPDGSHVTGSVTVNLKI